MIMTVLSEFCVAYLNSARLCYHNYVDV